MGTRIGELSRGASASGAWKNRALICAEGRQGARRLVLDQVLITLGGVNCAAVEGRRGSQIDTVARSAAANGLPSPLKLSNRDRGCAKTGVAQRLAGRRSLMNCEPANDD